jgi:hypothetical protein
MSLDREAGMHLLTFNEGRVRGHQGVSSSVVQGSNIAIDA